MTEAERAALDAEIDRCIWQCHYLHVRNLRQGDPLSWGGSVQADLKATGFDADLSAQPGPFATYLPCAALLMIKDEADFIRINLEWLHYIGVRRFVVMDNASTDGTWDEIARFRAAHPDVELLAIHDPIVAHFQGRKVSGMYHLAPRVWPDVEWVFPVDADELLNSRFGLRSLIYVPDEIDVLTITKVIHFRTRVAGLTRTESLPGCMPVRSTPFAVPPKVLVRAKRDLDIGQGNHYSIPAGDRRILHAGGLQYGFFHREFQTRSFGQFLSKVRNGGAAIRAALALGQRVGGDHWLAWHDLLSEGGEEALRAEYEKIAFREPGKGYVADEFRGVNATG
jgi:hypothetical protein